MAEILKSSTQEEIKKIKEALAKNLNRIRDGIAEIDNLLTENDKIKKKAGKIKKALAENLKKIRRSKEDCSYDK